LQAQLENVRATEWSRFPSDLQHLDVAAGENGASFAPEFAEFRKNELSLTIRGEVYRYNAHVFFQTNPSLLGQLIDFALEDASGGCAIDLYSGVGLFTLPLLRRFRRVMAVESNPNAVRFARWNLKDAGFDVATVNLENVADWLSSVATRDVDFILLDPPRIGAESAVIKGILDLHPPRISYVSCDPATLARDLKKLVAGGYVVQSLAAFDLFPQTHHVETVVHLRR